MSSFFIDRVGGLTSRCPPSCAAACLAILFLTNTGSGQAPSITATTPRAIAPGETRDITVTGGNLTGATELWTSFGERAPLSPDVENNGQDAGRTVFRVTAPADAIGIHGVRVTTPGGVSSLKLFVVDDLPTVAEAGGNATPETAQAVTLPCAIDGYVDNLSWDYFKFDAQAGQTVSFEVLARRLGSPLDPTLTLYRSDGRQLASQDDSPGLSSDCQFSYTFEEAGTYILRINDIAYAGGGNHIYRLRIGDFPCVNTAIPAGVQRGVPTTVSFAGADASEAVPAELNVPADFPGEWINVGTRRPGGQSSGFVMVHVGSEPEFVEQEPNNTPEEANAVALNMNFNGRLDQPGDVDRFSFDATQGQRFEFTGRSRRIGSPTDLKLLIFDAEGKQLAVVDDNGTDEGVLNFTFPADGRYTLAVRELNNKGGGRYGYRVRVAPYQPGFTLSATADVVNVPAGGVATITVNALRRDYGGAIDLSLQDLPAGLTSLPTRIGPGATLAVLTVKCDPGVAGGSLTPVKVVGTARIGEADVTSVASVRATLQGMWASTILVPGQLQESVALAVAPAKPLSLSIEPAEIVFGKELRATVKVIAQRGEGIDEAIQLAVIPEPGGLPANVTAEIKPIEKGQNEVEIAFVGNENAPLGPFTVVLNATHTKENVATVVPTPGIGLRLEAPFSLEPNIPEPKLAAGGELKFKVKLARNPAFAGEVKLTLDKLPAGVTAPEVVIPADQSEAEITLTAAADAAKGAANGIVVNAVAVANAKQTATAALPAVTVE